MSDESPPKSEIILYQTEDGRAQLEARLQKGTAGLSLNQLAELFQRDKSAISRHIKNLYEEAELRPVATVAEFATAQTEALEQAKRQGKSKRSNKKP